MTLRAEQTPKTFKFGIKMEYLMQKTRASENDSAVTGLTLDVHAVCCPRHFRGAAF